MGKEEKNAEERFLSSFFTLTNLGRVDRDSVIALNFAIFLVGCADMHIRILFCRRIVIGSVPNEIDIIHFGTLEILSGSRGNCYFFASTSVETHLGNLWVIESPIELLSHHVS